MNKLESWDSEARQLLKQMDTVLADLNRTYDRLKQVVSTLPSDRYVPAFCHTCGVCIGMVASGKDRFSGYCIYHDTTI